MDFVWFLWQWVSRLIVGSSRVTTITKVAVLVLAVAFALTEKSRLHFLVDASGEGDVEMGSLSQLPVGWLVFAAVTAPV